MTPIKFGIIGKPVPWGVQIYIVVMLSFEYFSLYGQKYERPKFGLSKLCQIHAGAKQTEALRILKFIYIQDVHSLVSLL